MKHGKKYVEGAKLIDRSKLYDPAFTHGYREASK